jgi:hypothetical protein
VVSTDGPTCVASGITLVLLEGRAVILPASPSAELISGVRLLVAWPSDRRRFLVVLLTTVTAEVTVPRLSFSGSATSCAESVCDVAALYEPSCPREKEWVVDACARSAFDIVQLPLVDSFMLANRLTWVSGFPDPDSGTTASASPVLRNISWSCVNLQGVS